MWCEYVFRCIDDIAMAPSIWTVLVVFFLASTITAFLFVAREPGSGVTPMPVSLIASVVAGAIITVVIYALIIGILQYFTIIVTATILIVGIISSAFAGKAVRDRK